MLERGKAYITVVGYTPPNAYRTWADGIVYYRKGESFRKPYRYQFGDVLMIEFPEGELPTLFLKVDDLKEILESLIPPHSIEEKEE